MQGELLEIRMVQVYQSLGIVNASSSFKDIPRFLVQSFQDYEAPCLLLRRMG